MERGCHPCSTQRLRRSWRNTTEVRVAPEEEVAGCVDTQTAQAERGSAPGAVKGVRLCLP